MKPFAHSILAALGAVVLLVALAILTPATSYSQAPRGGPQPSDVRVINDATEPVPTVAQGTTSVSGTVAISGTPSVAISGTPSVSLARTLVSGGQSFDLPPNPNIAFEFAIPSNVVLTDVVLTLRASSVATTIFLSDFTNTLLSHSVGSPGSTWAGTTNGHAAFHFQSGLQSPVGFRLGLVCNNIGGNSCAGALMWSGYQP